MCNTGGTLSPHRMRVCSCEQRVVGVQHSSMAQQLGETNYKEIIMNIDVETRDQMLEYVAL